MVVQMLLLKAARDAVCQRAACLYRPRITGIRGIDERIWIRHSVKCSEPTDGGISDGDWSRHR